ncbi:hypothetical protein SDC9_115808 [bioreactor metagenome]|uniref:Uncharacterized protein n=1 Tax=bioreactor metagenome TaxID=1076179 RepID=A0A645C0L8_9ZZZZ
MGVVLGKAAYPHEAVESTGELVAVYQAKLTHAQRQVAVGMGLGFENQHSAGTVHRLEGIIDVVDNRGIHVVFVMIPVAAAVPKLLVEDNGGGNLHVPRLGVDLPPIFDQFVFDHHALRQEEGEPGALVRQHEQAQLPAKLAVIALFGLLHPLEIGVQFLFLWESGSVDSLEHFLGGISPPVSASHRSELDAVALHPAGGIQMGAGA